MVGNNVILTQKFWQLKNSTSVSLIVATIFASMFICSFDLLERRINELMKIIYEISQSVKVLKSFSKLYIYQHFSYAIGFLIPIETLKIVQEMNLQ